MPCVELQPFGAFFRPLLEEVSPLKQGIHPDYQPATIKCACGQVIETGSTKKDIHIEICSNCHPFFTGKQKFVDAGGRVDKFRKRFESASAGKAE